MSPELLVLGGKIFVLGCIYTPDDLLEHWGMVFDPNLNEWTSLPIPPVPPLKTRFKIASRAAKIASCAVIDEKQFIVSLVFGSQLCVFDIESWNWSFIQLPRSCISIETNSKILVVSRMLYLFTCRRIYTYDLDQKEGSTDTMMIEMTGFYTPSCAGLIDAPFFPFHRGDNSFCFVWLPREHYKAIVTVSCVIHCLKFRVNPTINYHGKQVLEANIESCESYNAYGGELNDCVAVEGVNM
ncbi:hypothetical protein FRX31_005812 [Thalictrum thalictroides]|uniref:F-box/kelch-repeat protein n=1 Tax=Thalictrum thalictroides TaxID=46969 RepID=A0A7J6X4D3_THATH|nr:hypothetical protein FRX31_005812 [Thalictrum thalictroides]